MCVGRVSQLISLLMCVFVFFVTFLHLDSRPVSSAD